MNYLKRAFIRLADDQRAITSIEYALLASLIAVVCVAVLVQTGTSLNDLYMRVCDEVTGAIAGKPAC